MQKTYTNDKYFDIFFKAIGSPENREKMSEFEIKNWPPNFYFLAKTYHFFGL